MSGLFLNFYQVDLSTKSIDLEYLNYSDYESKESFKELRDKNQDKYFHRSDDKIIYWNKSNSTSESLSKNTINITDEIDPKVFSKIIEDSIVSFLKSKPEYNIFKNKHASTWDIISKKDLLQGRIDGLVVNRIVHLSSYFFLKDEKLIFGFTLSTSLKNSFTWSREDFIKNGIDVLGLKGDSNRIFSNKQSLKRFLESRGASSTYDSAIKQENSREKCFQVIDGFYNWIAKKKDEIVMPSGIQINGLIKRYIPFENNLIKSEILPKPERYFYSNKTNTSGLKYYNDMVKNYKPYSLELYQNKRINFGIICPTEFQGETEAYLKRIEAKLKDTFHFNDVGFTLVTIASKGLEDYKKAVYDDNILKSDLIFIIVSKDHEKLEERNSPYHVCKAKLIGNGIPTQDIQVETIRQNTSDFTMTNICLNTYAKLGGTAWTIEKEEKIREELVVGIGSTTGDNGEHILGIAQVFHNDGRYIMGDCAPLSTFDNYSTNLENHLFNTLKPIIDGMKQGETFRLIFHLYKSASEKYEITAINNLKDRLSSYNFEFALVHLGYGHNFRMYYNDGKYDTSQGTYVQLSKHSALLNFVPKSDLPLKIDLDKRSTFTSLFYLAKQVYWFSHLSHRSYMPSKRTVTIMYPSLMAKMTEELKKVDGWDYDRLKAVSEKLWFI